MTEDELVCALYKTRRYLRWMLWSCVLWPITLVLSWVFEAPGDIVSAAVLGEIIALAIGACLWCYRSWLLQQTPER